MDDFYYFWIRGYFEIPLISLFFVDRLDKSPHLLEKFELMQVLVYVDSLINSVSKPKSIQSSIFDRRLCSFLSESIKIFVIIIKNLIITQLL